MKVKYIVDKKPNCCRGCDLLKHRSTLGEGVTLTGANVYCGITGKAPNYEDFVFRLPDWCPLISEEQIVNSLRILFGEATNV